MRTKGLKPKDRKLATTVRPEAKKGKLTGNQWQNTPQQNQFMQNWLDPSSKTFGNAYQSAKAAGYNPYYAVKIASPDTANKWIGDYRKLAKLEMEHLEGKLIQLINGKVESRSPDDTRVKAIEVLARLKGILDNRNTTNVTLVQPILSGASVKAVVEGANILPEA